MKTEIWNTIEKRTCMRPWKKKKKISILKREWQLEIFKKETEDDSIVEVGDRNNIKGKEDTWTFEKKMTQYAKRKQLERCERNTRDDSNVEFDKIGNRKIKLQKVIFSENKLKLHDK